MLLNLASPLITTITSHALQSLNSVTASTDLQRTTTALSEHDTCPLDTDDASIQCKCSCPSCLHPSPQRLRNPYKPRVVSIASRDLRSNTESLLQCYTCSKEVNGFPVRYSDPLASRYLPRRRKVASTSCRPFSDDRALPNAFSRGVAPGS